MAEQKRSTNFSKSEEQKLVQLVLKKRYLNIIENKKTDAITSREKNIAWEKIAQQFNASSDNNIRTAKVLNEKYKNIKRLIRKRKTDNGEKVISTDYVEDMLDYLVHLNEKDDTQNDVDIYYADCLAGTSMDEDGTTSPQDWEKYNSPNQKYSKSNDFPSLKAPQRKKVTLTSIDNLKKQLLKQQYEHARVEHEQKIEFNRLEHEQRMIQAEEIHKIKIKLLETDLMLKGLEIQMPKHECVEV